MHCKFHSVSLRFIGCIETMQHGTNPEDRYVCFAMQPAQERCSEHILLALTTRNNAHEADGRTRALKGLSAATLSTGGSVEEVPYGRRRR